MFHALYDIDSPVLEVQQFKISFQLLKSLTWLDALAKQINWEIYTGGASPSKKGVSWYFLLKVL